MRPSRSSSRSRSHCGWLRIMNASPIFTPVRARTASSVSASATVRLIGFSHSTCLPASAALMSTAHASGWAGDCRSHRSPGRRAAPRTTHRRAIPSAFAALAFAVARSDRVTVVTAPLHRRQHLLQSNLRSAEDSPAKLLIHADHDKPAGRGRTRNRLICPESIHPAQSNT